MIFGGTQEKKKSPTFWTPTRWKPVPSSNIFSALHPSQQSQMHLNTIHHMLKIIIHSYQLGLIATLALKPATHPSPPKNHASVALPITNVNLARCYYLSAYETHHPIWNGSNNRYESVHVKSVFQGLTDACS